MKEVLGYFNNGHFFEISKGELENLIKQGYTFDEIKEMYAKKGKSLVEVKPTLSHKKENKEDYIEENEGKDSSCYQIEELESSRKTNYRKGQNLSKAEVINLFNEISSDAKNNRYYVGITCNPEQREEAHNADFLAVVDCPSMEAAKELEKSADKYGFDAGSVQGNVHKSSSKKVYIYKKTQKTKE